MADFKLDTSTLILESGSYYITSMTGKHVSRPSFVEGDFSLQPIIFLPEENESSLWPRWQIEKLSDGSYLLMSKAAFTLAVDGKVFASIASIADTSLPPAAWIITARPEHGPDIYSIQIRNTEQEPYGWVSLGSISDTQLCVRPHIVPINNPTQLPSNQLFRIVSIHNPYPADEKLNDATLEPATQEEFESF
ncbi:hypothetical protein C8Q75DRAFT_730247 [Abortiporus biennis]|nr:hypothetical protein C8Q75DRAFT_730247 [Abortiporus biennis]